MPLLVVGTALVFAGRAHVQLRTGVPPRSWLLMEALLAAGPAFGWGCAMFDASAAFWLAVGWLAIGLFCYIVGRIVARQYTERIEADGSTGHVLEADPMMQAFAAYKEVDRSVDFERIGEAQEEAARERRIKLVAAG